MAKAFVQTVAEVACVFQSEDGEQSSFAFAIPAVMSWSKMKMVIATIKVG